MFFAQIKFSINILSLEETDLPSLLSRTAIIIDVQNIPTFCTEKQFSRYKKTNFEEEIF